jgi:O-antigen ligase
MYTRVRLAVSGRARQSTAITIAAAVVLAILVGLLTVKLGSFQHQLKALVIVLAAFALVIAALRPDYGVVVMLVLIPFGFGFYGTGSATVLLWTLPYVMMWRIRFRDVPQWVLVGGAVLIAGSFIATLGAHNEGIAIEGAIDWLGALLTLCIAFTVFRGRSDAARRMVDILIVQAIVITLFGFLQQAGSSAVVGTEFNTGHPNSFFSYYTIYAGYLAMVATLALGEVLIALGERRYARVWVLGAALVLLLVGIAGSASRGGLLALGVGWLMLLVLNVRRGSVVARIAIVVVLAGAAGYLTTPHSTLVTIERRIATSNGGLSEDKTRFALQKAGERALREYPFGLGYGNFRYYLSEAVRTSKIRLPFFHAQETFIQVGLDAGWIGLAGFLVLLLTPILAAFRYGRDGSTVVRATAFAAALGGFIAQGLYDYVLWDVPFLIFFVGMIWGVTHSLRIREEAAHSIALTAG